MPRRWVSFMCGRTSENGSPVKRLWLWIWLMPGSASLHIVIKLTSSSPEHQICDLPKELSELGSVGSVLDDTELDVLAETLPELGVLVFVVFLLRVFLVLILILS